MLMRRSRRDHPGLMKTGRASEASEASTRPCGPSRRSRPGRGRARASAPRLSMCRTRARMPCEFVHDLLWTFGRSHSFKNSRPARGPSSSRTDGSGWASGPGIRRRLEAGRSEPDLHPLRDFATCPHRCRRPRGRPPRPDPGALAVAPVDVGERGVPAAAACHVMRNSRMSGNGDRGDRGRRADVQIVPCSSWCQGAKCWAHRFAIAIDGVGPSWVVCDQVGTLAGSCPSTDATHRTRACTQVYEAGPRSIRKTHRCCNARSTLFDRTAIGGV